MNTQDHAKYLVSHAEHDHRLLWAFVVILSSLALGLLPVVSFLNVSAPGNVVPHEAGMWSALGEKI